ncbi:MAG: DoxX family protein, partial [Pseudomonadota bacterium]
RRTSNALAPQALTVNPFDPLENPMNHVTRIDTATAILRISLGVMLFSHGFILKYMTFGLAGPAGFFESVGFPGWTAYLVFSVETVGGLALILGIGTRWVALAVLPVLLGATYVHLGAGWVFSNQGGGWEYPLYLVVLAVSQCLLGAGAWSLDRKFSLERKPE